MSEGHLASAWAALPSQHGESTALPALQDYGEDCPDACHPHSPNLCKGRWLVQWLLAPQDADTS